MTRMISRWRLRTIFAAILAGNLVGCLGPEPEPAPDAATDATSTSEASPSDDATLDAGSTGSDDGSDGSSDDASDGSPPDAAEAGPVCLDGGGCAPNDCQIGVDTCSATGSSSCTFSQNRTNGIPCDGGADGGAVCSSGACLSCSTGADCTPAGSCKQMNILCTTGTPVCTAAGNVTDGKPCGTNLFCNAGTCAACTAGADCAPAAKPCDLGTVSCVNGQVVCTDKTTPVANGTSCGSGMVCNAVACVSCTAGVTCTPATPCHTGQTSCATGASVCVDMGPGQDGVGCTGTNLCNQTYTCKSGTCTGTNPVTCTASDACHSAGTCNAATGTCSNPVATGASCNDNNACTTGDVCNSAGTCAGTAIACTATDACHPTGSCSAGACSYPVASGKSCGTNMTCNSAGTCACTAGLTSCGASCVNTSSDPANCGTCGHGCGGGTCSGGVCQMWEVAAQSGNAGALAADSAYIIWNNAGLYQIPVGGLAKGLNPTLIPSGTTPATISSGKVVWATSVTSPAITISFVNEGSTSVTTSVANNTGGGPFAIALNPGGNIAYVADTGGSSTSFHVDACTPLSASASCSSLAAITGASGATAFNFTTSSVGALFVASGSSVISLGLPGGAQSSVGGQNTFLAITADATNVYWVTTPNPVQSPVISIFRAPQSNVTAGGTTTLTSGVAVGTVFAAAASIASDGTNLYLATISATASTSGASYIASIPVGGGSLSAHLYDTPNVIQSLIDVGGTLYWAENVNNDVNPTTTIYGWRYP